MAKIFSGSIDGNSTLLMELPNHYVIGGHLYRKEGLTPVPGGTFMLPGPNYGTSRSGFLYGHAAGRGMWEDLYTELGTYFNGPADNPYDIPATCINVYTREEKPRPFIMDTSFPNFAYVLATGTFNPRGIVTRPINNSGHNGIDVGTGNFVNVIKDDEIRPCQFYKIDLKNNSIVWSASPDVFFTDLLIYKQDEEFLYFYGATKYNVKTSAMRPLMGTINKATGAVTWYNTSMQSTLVITPQNYFIQSAISGTYNSNSRFLGFKDNRIWSFSSYPYSSYANYGMLTAATVDELKVGITGVSEQNFVVVAGGPDITTQASLVQFYCSPALQKADNNTYIYSMGNSQGGSATKFYGLQRRKIFVYPVNATNCAQRRFFNNSDTNLLSLPVPLAFQIQAPYTYQTNLRHGIHNVYAFERDNGDSSYTTYVLSLFHITRSGLANDDSSVCNHFVRLDVESEGDVATSNKATLLQTIYDANYGIVWIDKFTFMTVGLNRIRVYKVDLQSESVMLLNTYEVSSPGYEIVYGAVDTSKNIWYVERSMPNKTVYNVYFETAYIISSVEIEFEQLEADYTGTPIASNITVATKNNVGDYLVSDVKLELSGPAKFTSNNLKEITITTLNNGVNTIPITITGPGYVNCVGTVVS